MARDPLLVPLGVRIAAARKAAGYRSQDDLAEALDLSRQMVGFIEQGRAPVPVLKAARLGRLLGIPLAELFPAEKVDKSLLRVLDLMDSVPPGKQDEVIDLLEKFVRIVRKNDL